MSHPHFTPKETKNQIPQTREALPDPEYIPDWTDLEEKAEIMATYWSHVAQLARLEQTMERLGVGGEL